MLVTTASATTHNLRLVHIHQVLAAKPVVPLFRAVGSTLTNIIDFLYYSNYVRSDSTDQRLGLVEKFEARERRSSSYEGSDSLCIKALRLRPGHLQK
jgi:hypothetical protein